MTAFSLLSPLVYCITATLKSQSVYPKADNQGEALYVIRRSRNGIITK